MAPSVKSLDLPNLLLGLAWLGELDRRQIQRLWFAGKSESTVEKTLARLYKEGLLDKHIGSVRDEQRGVTVPLLARWSLTPAGHKEIKANKDYPPKPVIPREKRLFAHDARTTATVVRLIELGQRYGLSGIYIAHELPLNPRQRRPVCDALVVMQFGLTEQPNLVPWTKTPPTGAEGLLRFAVEADNNTEPLAVLGSKAETYRSLATNRDWSRAWSEQHGPLPVPLWVAPTKGRAEAIQRAWKRAWPEGEWLITSDEGLERNELLSWREGQECTMSLSFGKLRPAMPAPPTSAAPQPGQRKVASTVEAPVAPTAPHPPVFALAASPSPAIPSPTGGVSPAVSAPASAALPTKGKGAPRSLRDIARAWKLLGQLVWAGVELLDAFGGLLWRLLHVLWVALQLPWRVVRWYRALNNPTYTYVRSAAITLALLLVVLSLAVTMVRLGWLPNPLDETSANTLSAAETPSPAVPIEAAPLEATPSLPACPPVRVTANRLRLRAGPGEHSPILRTLEKNELLSVKDCIGVKPDKYTWWRVVDGRGVEGWVASDWLEEITSTGGSHE